MAHSNGFVVCGKPVVVVVVVVVDDDDDNVESHFR